MAGTGPRGLRGLRWWIIGLVAAGVATNYLARSTLGVVVAAHIPGVMSLDAKHYSYVVAGFQLAYTVMQPVAGYVLDVLGTRLGLVLFAAAWSVANMLHAFVGNWQQLTIARGLLGAVEASAIPGGVKVVGEWFPAKERSVATGWFNIGASIGAIVAPFLVAWCILALDWRFAFIITGAVGLVWAALWWVSYRKPSQHPAIGSEERAHIESGQPASDGARVSWLKIVTTRKFWGLALSRFMAEPAWQTFTFWIPLYLATARHMDIKSIAAFAWLPFVAADLGSVIGGYLSPFFVNTFKTSLLTSRKLVAASGAILMAGPAFIGFAGDPYSAIALFCVGGFAHQVISGAILTTSSDVFTSGELATANGFMGAAAWTGGLSFSLVVGQLASAVGYNPLFACLVAFDLVAALLLWVLVRPQDLLASR